MWLLYNFDILASDSNKFYNFDILASDSNKFKLINKGKFTYQTWQASFE